MKKTLNLGWRAVPFIVFVFFCFSGCESPDEPVEHRSSSTLTSESTKVVEEFILKPKADLKKLPKENIGKLVDINLGHGPDAFLETLWYQLKGESISPENLNKWLEAWKLNPQWRRIDLAIQLSEQAGVHPKYEYSDPWIQQIPLLSQAPKKVKRELGAVCMFFFHCPDGVNGKMSWANIHSPGMKIPDPICKIEPQDSGYYNPNNAGFWKMELLDARYAGLQFLLLNTYGPDIENDKLKPLQRALESVEKLNLNNTVKLGLFDDSWTWGKKYFSDFWKTVPDMNDPAACAELLYRAKWKPFFTAIPRKHWYLFKGQPLIYFYNGGTIQHRENSEEVFKLMKALFAKDFGVEPFLCVDSAFAPKGKNESANQIFKWFSLDKKVEESTYIKDNVSMTHAMVRWDSTSRSNHEQERMANDKDLLYKNDRLLKNLLNNTQDKDLVVIATWNDLGEGTGINRCFDYFWDGQWQKPDVFMQLIRKSQAGEMLNVDGL